MARLQETTPAAGLGAVEIGGWRLAEAAPVPMALVMPLKGQGAAVSEAMEQALGTGFPQPGRTARNGETWAIWAGREQALVLGAVPALDGAAVTDQSDAWAMFDLSGPNVDRVLARICPVDLRPRVFPEGATARTLLGHMSASITRIAPETLRILVFRSMARTAHHELARAMEQAAF
ncbi:sarcosine oxidase subunit gamma [Oceaniglobus roseus]|uniref:sarcosine oxidase subunit gamma n=1 Tax=Oceaniglobus roseus TaxID=1737570 RepID=UPI000C7F390E|nr:sarcosine oxidase subunit gamma [Kandeliimicrobium roseum]